MRSGRIPVSVMYVSAPWCFSDDFIVKPSCNLECVSERQPGESHHPDKQESTLNPPFYNTGGSASSLGSLHLRQGKHLPVS